MSDFRTIIGELERQRSSIDRAIQALRGIDPVASEVQPATEKAVRKHRKHQLSEEGRRRISEAARRRWATQAAQTAPASSNGRKARRG